MEKQATRNWTYSSLILTRERVNRDTPRSITLVPTLVTIAYRAGR